jgi:hypothetical protein
MVEIAKDSIIEMFACFPIDEMKDGCCRIQHMFKTNQIPRAYPSIPKQRFPRLFPHLLASLLGLRIQV